MNRAQRRAVASEVRRGSLPEEHTAEQLEEIELSPRPVWEEPDPDEFLRVADIAKLFHVAKCTVFRWHNEGKLTLERRSPKVVGMTRRALREVKF